MPAGAQTASQVYAGTGLNLVETSGPHGDLPTAQPIPDASFVRLSGALTATDQLDLYKIPTDPDTLALQITVTASGASSTLPGRVWMLDEAGHIIGDWHIPPGTHAITVSFRAAETPRDPAFIFGISHGDTTPSDPSAPPETYLVTVARENGPGTLLSPAPGPLVTLPPAGATLRPATPVAEPALAPTAAPGSVGIDVSQVPTGPLPTRSAGPSGGRFADGDPVPPIDRFDAALVDLKLLEILPASPAQAARQSDALTLEPSRTHPAEIPSLVALPAAGGFPLLAANLSSEPIVASPSVAVLPLLGASGSGCHESEPAAGQPGAPREPADAPATADRGRAAQAARGPILVGLNVAATLAFGLLLPDLVAALQGISPRRELPEILQNRTARRTDEWDT